MCEVLSLADRKLFFGRQVFIFHYDIHVNSHGLFFIVHFELIEIRIVILSTLCLGILSQQYQN